MTVAGDTSPMADTIGWGDERSPRQRHRWLWPAGLVVVAMAVAAAMLVPAVERHRARDAAGWVQRTWALRDAYDQARTVVVDTVLQRAGATDDRIVDDAARFADRQEARALDRLAGEVTRHPTHAADVAAAAHEVARAFGLESLELRQDATALHPATGYFVPANTTLIDSADVLVRQAATGHGLSGTPPKTPVVHLPAATAQLARLRRPTDVETGLRLIASGDHGFTAYDLDTGAHTRLPALVDPRGGFSVTPSGDTLVVVGVHDATIVRENRTIVVTRHPRDGIWTLPTGGLWLQHRGRVRFVRTSGRRSPWRRLPTDFRPVAATRHRLVLTRSGYAPEIGTQPMLWAPLSGRSAASLPPPCGQYATTAAQILYTQCSHPHQLDVYDVASGRTRTIDVHHEILDYQLTPAPDGRSVEIQLVADPGDRDVIVDLATGEMTRLPDDVGLRPALWSPNGRWLLFTRPDGGPTQLPATAWFALWDTRTQRLMSLRLHGFDGSDVTPFALLPARATS